MKFLKNLIPLLVIALIYTLIEFAHSMEFVNNYFIQVLILACINIMLTVALNLVNGMTGQNSLGHAGFMGVGAYFAAIITTLVFDVAAMNPVMQVIMFLLATLAGGIFAAICGFIIGAPSLRLRGDYLAIVTLGFCEVVRTIIRTLQIVDGARGFSGIPKLSSFFWSFLFMIITIYICRNIIDSSHGRASMAIRDNEIAANAMGINPTRFKVMAFVISAFICGVAGSLYAHTMRFLHPDVFAYTKSVDLLVYLYAGGVGSISGAAIGAFTLTVLPEVLRFLEDWRLVIYGVLLVVIILFRPIGIFGGKEFAFLKMRNGGIQHVGFGSLFRYRQKQAAKAGSGKGEV